VLEVLSQLRVLERALKADVQRPSRGIGSEHHVVARGTPGDAQGQFHNPGLTQDSILPHRRRQGRIKARPAQSAFDVVDQAERVPGNRKSGDAFPRLIVVRGIAHPGDVSAEADDRHQLAEHGLAAPPDVRVDQDERCGSVKRIAAYRCQEQRQPCRTMFRASEGKVADQVQQRSGSVKCLTSCWVLRHRYLNVRGEVKPGLLIVSSVLKNRSVRPQYRRRHDGGEGPDVIPVAALGNSTRAPDRGVFGNQAVFRRFREGDMSRQSLADHGLRQRAYRRCT